MTLSTILINDEMIIYSKCFKIKLKNMLFYLISFKRIEIKRIFTTIKLILFKELFINYKECTTF
jgi:hypothetical protein